MLTLSQEITLVWVSQIMTNIYHLRDLLSAFLDWALYSGQIPLPIGNFSIDLERTCELITYQIRYHNLFVVAYALFLQSTNLTIAHNTEAFT